MLTVQEPLSFETRRWLSETRGASTQGRNSVGEEQSDASDISRTNGLARSEDITFLAFQLLTQLTSATCVV